MIYAAAWKVSDCSRVPRQLDGLPPGSERWAISDDALTIFESQNWRSARPESLFRFRQERAGDCTKRTMEEEEDGVMKSGRIQLYGEALCSRCFLS